MSGRRPDQQGGQGKKNIDSGYWRSFSDLYHDQASAEQLVPGAEALDRDTFSTISRRRFLAMLGVSAAFAGAGCTPYRDRGKIVSYLDGQEGLLPGTASYYASTLTLGGQGYGVLIKTREGRPIKIDGNPEHPFNLGKIPVALQTAIVDLYDPTRYQFPQYRHPSERTFSEISWAKADQELMTVFGDAVAAGKEIAIVGNTHLSPTTERVIGDFVKRYPTARHYQYQQFDRTTANRAWRVAFGDLPQPLYRFDKADVILGVEGDFLGAEPESIRYSRQYTSRRETLGKLDFNRLYAVEADVSITGMNADYRIKVRPGDQLSLLRGITAAIAARKGVEAPFEATGVAHLAAQYDVDEKVLSHLVDDLARAGSRALVYVGQYQDPRIQLLGHYLNSLLSGNDHLDWRMVHSVLQRQHALDELSALSERMKANAVAVVIHLDSNPVYHLPPQLEYAKALQQVATVVGIAQFEDETSALSHYLLPLHNVLESWGDSHAFDGVYSLAQPVIEPRYNSRQAEAMLLIWSGGGALEYSDQLYYQYLKGHWQEVIYPMFGSAPPFRDFWNSALHDGAVSLSINHSNHADALEFIGSITPGEESEQAKSRYTVILKPGFYLGDGTHACSAWLQELPHPVSKVTWDNYAAMSLATARELGVTNDDRISVANGERQIDLPVFVQPGMADGTLVVQMGYGRKLAGPIGSDVGVDANHLRGDVRQFPWQVSGVMVSKASGRYPLASTQQHHVLDFERVAGVVKDRQLVQESTVGEYVNNPDLIRQQRHHPVSINENQVYPGVKWGMAIDLNKCIGCGHCVAACGVENNSPSVGKEQVALGREMHWLRIDRYYSGTPEEPQVSIQPMLCQHCDNAPCENVCPVLATAHSPEGLNDMAYNRCIGSRYCANNCPYKVRRFNYFDYRERLASGFFAADGMALLHNPEVTVRPRGVMEKCTFCTQRLMEEKDKAREQGRDVDGSRVKTACQQACPTDAIVFGDLNQRGSLLRSYREHPLGYHVLEAINVRPNVTYIARLRNRVSEEQA